MKPLAGTLTAEHLQTVEGGSPVITPSTYAPQAGDTRLALLAKIAGGLAALAEAFDSKAGVLCASTENIDLLEIVWNSTVIDGVTITAAGQRFLAKDQFDPEDNGIWISRESGWSAVRAADSDTWDKLVDSHVVVRSGTVNAATHWLCTVSAGGTLGTTSVTYAAIS
jgi:hypothetical protein